MNTPRPLAALVLALLAAAPAWAHISMDHPQPRFDDGQNKWCPCGTGGNGSRQNDGCEVSDTDPNRSEVVTTFSPGESLTIQWRETIGHTGRFRVSFDPDGADQADFDANILADIADPGGSGGNTGNGNNWEVTVEIPSTPCENCTLQLIQVMNGNTADPVFDLTGTGTYFQCADIVIAGNEGEGEADGEGEDDGGGDDDDGGGSCNSGAAPLALALLPLLRRRRR
jgi:MYXO-CTERM domain-containing protein